MAFRVFASAVVVAMAVALCVGVSAAGALPDGRAYELVTRVVNGGHEEGVSGVSPNFAAASVGGGAHAPADKSRTCREHDHRLEHCGPVRGRTEQHDRDRNGSLRGERPDRLCAQRNHARFEDPARTQASGRGNGHPHRADRGGANTTVQPPTITRARRDVRSVAAHRDDTHTGTRTARAERARQTRRSPRCSRPARRCHSPPRSARSRSASLATTGNRTSPSSTPNCPPACWDC